MEDSCYFSCFLEIILVFVDVFLCLSWHSVLTLFLFCPTVLLVLFLFYGFSLPLIRSRRFLVDFHASFLLVNQFSPLSHCLFWLFVFGYAFGTAYRLELIFWTTSAYTALFPRIILTWVLFVNISQCLFMFLNLFFVLDIVIVGSIRKFSWFLLLFRLVFVDVRLMLTNCILMIILLLILSWALIKLSLLIQWMFVIICIDWVMVV